MSTPIRFMHASGSHEPTAIGSPIGRTITCRRYSVVDTRPVATPLAIDDARAIARAWMDAAQMLGAHAAADAA